MALKVVLLKYYCTLDLHVEEGEEIGGGDPTLCKEVAAGGEGQMRWSKESYSTSGILYVWNQWPVIDEKST